MPGQLIPVIAKMTITVPTATTGSPSSFQFPAKGISTVGFREGTLITRVHSLSGSLGAGAGQANTVKVEVLGEAPTMEDPSMDFVLGTAIASTSIDSTTTSASVGADQQGVAISAAFSANFPAFVRVKLTQFGIAGSAVTITLSADIVLKS